MRAPIWKIVLGAPGLHQFSTKEAEIEAWTGAEAEEIAREKFGYLWQVLPRLTAKIRGSYESEN